MKKSLIALAVAGAFAAPAFAATSNVDMYGQVRLSIDSNSNGGGYSVNDRVSRVGIKGTEDLGGGLKAVWQWESALNNLDVAGATNVAAGSQRNTFIGLAGSFGTVVGGVHDTPYKLAGSADAFGDTAADSQNKGSSGGIIGRNGFDTRSNNALAYISPDWSGFHFAAAVIADEAGNTGSAHAAKSLALVYANGPLKATFGNESYKNGRSANKYNVSYKMGDIGLGATYEKSNDFNGAAKDTAYLLSATYGMGPITLAAQYGNFNDKDDTASLLADTGTKVDVKRTTVGGIYSLSKRTNAALAYNHDTNSNGAAADTTVNTWTVQLNHSF